MSIKRVWDLDVTEKAALTEEQVKRYIDLEIAYDKIEPVECPEPPSLEAEGIVRSEKAFKVAGIVVRTLEDAKQIQKCSLMKPEYDYQLGYKNEWLTPFVEPEIEQVAYYKQEDVSRIADALQNNEAKRRAYEAEKNRWDKYIQETGRIRNSVWQEINDAKQVVAKIDLAKKTYDKYVDLAGGDVQIAADFFRNTYADEPDLIEAVLGEVPEPACDAEFPS